MVVIPESEAIIAIEAEMRATIRAARQWLAGSEPARAGGEGMVDSLYGMMAYHLGWVDADFRPTPADGGKKLRGQLCLLACAALGGEQGRALPLAAAIELLHNFTLIHDDIQDRSLLRRHRPTVWRLWGIGQAINAGDGLYAFARLALLRLAECGVPADLTLALAQDCERTLLRIMEGQYLDLRFEAEAAASPPLYERMIAGKTASLIDFCLEAGGRLGGADPTEAAALGRCGRALGLGFQVRDDILGIWGAEAVTGKPPAADLRARKQSLPVLIALESASPTDRAIIQAAYAKPEPDDDDVAALLTVLARTNAQAGSQTWVERYHAEAVAALATLGRDNPATAAIRTLIERLVAREF